MVCGARRAQLLDVALKAAALNGTDW